MGEDLGAMGLDVYVGPLTRYYIGDWETVVQQAAREQGTPVHVIRPGGTSDDPEIQELIDSLGEPSAGDGGDDLTPAQISEAVTNWRDVVSAAIDVPLEWNEDASAPYFTDKPAWDGYGSLQVLAACAERSERKLPKTAVEDWTDNNVWRKAANGRDPRFSHLYFPELWVPLDLHAVVEGQDVAGNEVGIGSSLRLHEDLQAINEQTFRGSASDIAQWRFEGAEHGGPFEDAAKFGLAVFLELAAESVKNRLPMKLDY